MQTLYLFPPPLSLSENGGTFMSNQDNQQAAKQRTIEIDGQQIPVIEEVYRAFKRPAWAEHKRQEREKRCRDENGNRCTKDCRLCDKTREGSVLSLDRFAEQGFEPAESTDIDELIAEKELLNELYAALDELDPENRRIMDLFKVGMSEREIAADIGLSQKAINKRKTKIFAQLRERLKHWA
jgi:RNA polymerase sigma factor (sigma-70 family)